MKLLTRTQTAALFAVATSLLLSSAAEARNPVVLKLTDGLNAGPTGDNDGPGAEQATVVQSLMNGKRYVTTVWMSSQVDNDPYQCKCAAVELDPLTGPRTVAGPVTITDNDGNRPCNHPHMDINPLTNQILWSYGTNDPNQANVQPYVQGLDPLCNVTTNRVQIGNDNGNDGAPWAALINPTTGLFQVGYLENNERSRAVGVSFSPGGDIDVLFNRTIVDPANIGRPSVARFSDTAAMFCSSNGDNRPPEIGVACAMVDALTGDKVWNVQNCGSNNASDGTCVIARSEPNNNPEIYYNQPVIAVGDNGRFFLQVERSNNNNNGQSRGATTTMMYTLLPDTLGPNTQANIVNGIGANQVHATVCTGKYGAEEKLHTAIFDASITGSGFAQVQMAAFDIIGTTLTPVENPKVLGAFPGDSGYLANLYGNNPNTQGRDFMRCIGDIPNPGFGVTGGFLPSVKSFFAFPFAGRVPGEEKNSLFLSMLPAEEPVPAPVIVHDLNVSVAGNGLVLSNPLGIDGCDGSVPCIGSFDDGVTVTLTALPATGSSFTGWSGDCTGSGVCSVSMTAARSVTATFVVGDVPVDPNDPVGLIVTVVGDGAGTVTSDPAGTDCSAGTCANNFGRNQQVTLTATPAQGSKFVGWIGDCTGTEPCVLTMDGARQLTATFNIDPDAPPPPAEQPIGIVLGDGCGDCSTSGPSGTFSAVAFLALVGLLSRRRRSLLLSASTGALVLVIAATSGCLLNLAPPAPTINAFASKSTTAVAVGQPVELTYSVAEAESVTVTMIGTGDLLTDSTQLEGSIFTQPLVSSTTFVLVAKNGESSATKTLNVIVGIPDVGTGEVVGTHAAILAFSPSASDIESGQSATLSWQTSGASSGVILANDAILTTINAADVASGTFSVTPLAATVYTLSVIGSDGQQVTLTTAVSVSAIGAGPVTGRVMFDGTVLNMLDQKCGSCHEANNPSGYPDLFGASTATYYDRIIADPRFLTALPEDSLFIIKGEHTGPAFLPAEAQAVTAWLVKEAQERGLAGTPGTPPPAGDFTPRSLTEALTRFGACMNRQVWDNTYGQGNNTQTARQGSDQGQCMACHSSGTAGAFLSGSSGDTFEMNKARPYVLKLVLSTANSDGSFRDLVPANRFALKGGEGGDHPSYLLTDDRLQAINSFVDQTLVSFHDYTQDCAAPPVGP